MRWCSPHKSEAGNLIYPSHLPSLKSQTKIYKLNHLGLVVFKYNHRLKHLLLVSLIFCIFLDLFNIVFGRCDRKWCITYDFYPWWGISCFFCNIWWFIFIYWFLVFFIRLKVDLPNIFEDTGNGSERKENEFHHIWFKRHTIYVNLWLLLGKEHF